VHVTTAYFYLGRTAQHSTAQHSTAQHSTAQHSTAEQSRADERHDRNGYSNMNVMFERFCSGYMHSACIQQSHCDMTRNRGTWKHVTRARAWDAVMTY